MNPCESCGACCASLRVTLPWEEVDAGGTGSGVPEALVEPYANVAAMRTDHAGRCVALRGAVGGAVRCVIYDRRPAACRDFAPLATLGRGDAACDAARRRHGLAALEAA